MKPEAPTTAWTVDTLKEYFEARLYANETAIEAAKTGSDAAINAAKESTEIALYAEKSNRDIALAIARDAAFKAIDAARDSLTERLKNGDEKLLVHIEAQKESTISALDALKGLLAEKDKATTIADQKQSEAVNKAEAQLARRLEEINHSRAQALQERSSYLTRDMHEVAVAEIRVQLNRGRDELNGRLLKETFDTTMKEQAVWKAEINEFKTTIQGRGEGVSSSAKAAMYVLSAISLIVGVFSAMIAWNNSPSEVATQSAKQTSYNAHRLDALERQPYMQPAQAAPVTITNPPSRPVPTQQQP